MITANWNIKCNVDCPYCGYQIEILSEINDSYEFLPDMGEISDVDIDIDCPKCNRQFSIQRVEH